MLDACHSFGAMCDLVNRHGLFVLLQPRCLCGTNPVVTFSAGKIFLDELIIYDKLYLI